MESPGYYPTAQELGLMGGESHEMYRRSRGGLNAGGPDAGSLTASGIWRQEPDPTVSFYEQHNRFFNGLDSALGPLVPGELMLWENSPAREYIHGYTDFGFPLTRDFNPDLAHAKFGPLYFDLLKASAALLYSDYEGTPVLANDDGWLSMLNLDFRAAAQLTPNLFLTLSGSVYYLPSKGSVGFLMGDGSGGSSIRLGYTGAIDYWQYAIYNDVSIQHRLSDVFDEVAHDEIDVAGRYRFGRDDDSRSNDFLDGDGFYVGNTAGTVFTGPMGELINATIRLERDDFWESLDFEDHRYTHTLTGRLDYMGFEWPVIPYFAYQLSADNGVDVLYEWFKVGARARLSENVRLTGHVGYFRTHGLRNEERQPSGEIGIIQQLSARTSHSLFAGADYHRERYGEALFANYVRYSLSHRFGTRLTGSWFLQLADVDNLDGTARDRSGLSTGGRLTARVSDYTLVRLGVDYDEWDDAGAIQDRRRWLYRATLAQRLQPFLTGRLLYLYEDNESDRTDYNEHLYMISLDYFF